MTTVSPTQHALLATPYFAPAIGGVERYVEHLVSALANEGWTASIVTTAAAGGSPDVLIEERDGVRVYRLPVARKVSNTPVGRRWTSALREVIAAERPAVLNAHAPVPLFADLAARAAGNVPLVLTYHTGRMRKGHLLPDITLKGYERFGLPRTARRAERVICSSDYVADTFSDLFFAKATVIRPAVELGRFPCTPLPPERRLLFVASLMTATAYKGLDDLLVALAILSKQGDDVRLEVVGSGDAESNYRARAHELGLDERVDFSGALSGEAVAEAYRRCRLLVLPTRYDSLPTVVVEAMASGRPVVTTPIGGLPSLLADSGGGVITPPADPQALADMITRTLDRPDLADLGRRGRAYVEDHLTWTRQAQRTVEVFESAIRERDPARPPRVAVLAPYFAPHIGGVERYAQRLATELADRGGTPIIITTAEPGARKSYGEVAGLPVVRLPAMARVSNTPVNPAWAWQLRRLYSRLRVDVVHAHSPVPFLADVGLAVAGRNRGSVLTYHSGTMTKGSCWTDWAINAYERHVLPHLFDSVDHLSASSTTCLASDRAACEIWSPGVDVDLFRPGRNLPSATPPTVLYVGRMEHASAWKGVDVLVEAFASVVAQVANARLVLVGGGDAVTDHLRLAHQLEIGNSVEAIGELSGAKLVEAYQAARVVVLPSLTDAESFGMTLVEAMACGRPVVGSSVGGIPHVIDHGANGLVVPPGDVVGLADACRLILTDDALADRVGDTGRRHAEEAFTWSRTVNAYADTIARMPARS